MFVNDHESVEYCFWGDKKFQQVGELTNVESESNQNWLSMLGKKKCFYHCKFQLRVSLGFECWIILEDCLLYFLKWMIWEKKCQQVGTMLLPNRKCSSVHHPHWGDTPLLPHQESLKIRIMSPREKSPKAGDTWMNLWTSADNLSAQGVSFPACGKTPTKEFF